MAKISRALAIVPKKPLAIRDAQLEVIPPKRGQLGPVRERGQIVPVKDRTIVPSKRGDGTVVVAGDGRTVNERGEATSPNGSRIESPRSKLKGVIPVASAAAIAAEFIAPADLQAFEDALDAGKLSWGNKREKQALANKGTIYRRKGGAGYGRDKSGDPVRQKDDEQTAGDAKQPGDYVSKKRSSAKLQSPDELAAEDLKALPAGDRKAVLALPAGDRKAVLALPAGDRQSLLALPASDRKAVLALPAGKKRTDALGAIAETRQAALDAVEKGKKVGAAYEEAKAKVGEAVETARAIPIVDTAVQLGKARLAKIKDLWNAGKKEKAVKEAVGVGWGPIAKYQLEAFTWLEKRLTGRKEK